jgi:CHAT domain-containing protein
VSGIAAALAGSKCAVWGEGAAAGIAVSSTSSGYELETSAAASEAASRAASCTIRRARCEFYTLRPTRTTPPISALTGRFSSVAADPISFAFLPGLKIEDLPAELGRHKPDILHIAAHGDVAFLALADQDGVAIPITGEMLSAFLAPDHLPRLVYLNACNSGEIAQTLIDTGQVAMAIGSTAPITNRSARAAAVAFYERILIGMSAARAFDACQRMLDALSQGQASVKLCTASGIDPAKEILHPVPTLIADFQDKNPKPDADGEYGLRVGIQGCPPDTTQVIFFTDDSSFINDEETLEEDLSVVVRTTPVAGTIWTPEDVWWVEGDHRLVAVGVKAGSGCFVIESTLCRAIEDRYLFSHVGSIPEVVQIALNTLRENNGAQLDPTVWDAQSQARAPGKRNNRQRGVTRKKSTRRS